MRSSSKKAEEVQDVVKNVKENFFAIGRTAIRKDEDGCRKLPVVGSSGLEGYWKLPLSEHGAMTFRALIRMTLCKA